MIEKLGTIAVAIYVGWMLVSGHTPLDPDASRRLPGGVPAEPDRVPGPAEEAPRGGDA